MKNRSITPQDIATDYYKLLGVDPDSDPSAIRSAYRTAIVQAHPDRGGSNQAAARLNRASEVLLDRELRRAYDLRHPRTEPGGVGRTTRYPSPPARPHAPDFHGSVLFAIVMFLINLYASAPNRSVPLAPKELRATIVSSVPVSPDGKGVDHIVVVLSDGSWVTARYRGSQQLYKGQSVRVTETVGDGDALYLISEPKSLLD